MRLAGMVSFSVTVALAGCSLDLVENGDEAPPSDPPDPACALGPRYHTPQADCGPVPPDEPPPTDCWWTIQVLPATIEYCWTDVCENLTYECTGSTVTAHRDVRTFHGTVLSTGNLMWDGAGDRGGEYAPY